MCHQILVILKFLAIPAYLFSINRRQIVSLSYHRLDKDRIDDTNGSESSDAYEITLGIKLHIEDFKCQWR